MKGPRNEASSWWVLLPLSPCHPAWTLITQGSQLCACSSLSSTSIQGIWSRAASEPGWCLQSPFIEIFSMGQTVSMALMVWTSDLILPWFRSFVGSPCMEYMPSGFISGYFSKCIMKTLKQIHTDMLIHSFSWFMMKVQRQVNGKRKIPSANYTGTIYIWVTFDFYLMTYTKGYWLSLHTMHKN